MYCHKLIHRYALIALAYQVGIATAVNCRLKGSNRTSPCYCKKLSDYHTPWSDGLADTAPAARNVSLSFFEEDGIVLPKITWTVSAQYLDYIEGFYIEVIILESYPIWFNCSINSDRVKKLEKRNKVSFHFKNCCHELAYGLDPGDNVHTLISSLPLYSQGDNPYFVTAERTVQEPTEPSYYDDEPYTGTKVVTATTTLLNVKSQLNKDMVLALLIGLAVFLLAITVLTVILCLRRSKQIKKGYMSTATAKRILFISSEESQYMVLYNGLIESIKKCCVKEAEIIANIRRQNETSSCAIIPWITKNMREADTVVIVISNSSHLDDDAAATKTSNIDRSTVTVALNVAQAVAVDTNFQNMKRRFIALHIGGIIQDTDLVPYCSHYSIPKQMEDALKHILGTNYNVAYKTDDVATFILKQLSIIHDTLLQLESDDVENRPALNSNDLNQSLIESLPVDINDLDKSILYYSNHKTDNDESIDNNLSMV